MNGIWRESGYADFSDGSFGNGGQNLYVSRSGVLQRIFHFDLNRDGYVDLVFANSQDFNERPPVLCCTDILGQCAMSELPTHGACSGAVGDLNGDGYDDLVIANQNDGVHTDLMAFVYYGSPEGLGERYKLELPAPNSRAVAIGDFNGDGRPDIAFGSDGRLRIFYQAAEGFRPWEYVDLEANATHMAAADLDGDGCSEIYARIADERPRVFWGDPAGISLDRHTIVGGADASAETTAGSSAGSIWFTRSWMPAILRIDGSLYLFRAFESHAALYPVVGGREIGEPLLVTCADVSGAAAGDVNGDGHDDLVLTVCRDSDTREQSWVYWGSDAGFRSDRRTSLSTQGARAPAVGDLNGNGCADVVICQGRTGVVSTTESLVFRSGADGLDPEPVRITTHDAMAALLARTSDHEHPQVLFINRLGGRVRGDVPSYIYYGGKDGFTADRRAELPGWSPPGAVACDFNDDGWADLLICNCCEDAVAYGIDPGSFLFWGGPDGFNANDKTVIPTIRGHGCVVGDFRHAGYLDLLVTGFINLEILHFCGGPQGFDLEHPRRLLIDDSIPDYDPKGLTYGTDPAPRELSEVRWPLAADFNNDGWLDVFVPLIEGYRSFILWGGPDGFSMERATWLNTEGACCPQAADLTGNGYLDLVVGGYQCKSKTHARESYLYIYWGGPEGFSEDRRAQLPTHAGDSIAIADFNNDGILDIFVGSYHHGRVRDGNSYIYWGAPGGHYSALNHTRLWTHSASGCIAADFNEDGWVDLAVASHKTRGNHEGFSQVWWNGPDGFSENRMSLLPTKGPHGMFFVNAGNAMDRGPEEYYVSSPYEMPAAARAFTVRWDAELPVKTWVRAQLRFAPTREELDTAIWRGPAAPDTWFENGQRLEGNECIGPWLQYRLALGAVNSGATPRVTSVEVAYE